MKIVMLTHECLILSYETISPVSGEISTILLYLYTSYHGLCSATTSCGDYGRCCDNL